MTSNAQSGLNVVQGSTSDVQALNVYRQLSREEASEFYVCRLDCDLAKATTMVITVGVIAPYFQKLCGKAERAGLACGKVKQFLNQSAKLLSRLNVAVADIERNIYFPCTSAIFPGFAHKYSNHTLTSSIQFSWMKAHEQAVKNLYVLRSKVYQHMKIAHPDVSACIDLIVTMAKIATFNMRRCEQTLRSQMGAYYKCGSMTNVNLLVSLQQTLINLDSLLVEEKYDDFMVTQTTEAVRGLNDAVANELAVDRMQYLINKSVMDYFEFYIAYVVQLMQRGKFGKREYDIVIEDTKRLKVDSMFPLRCIKDWKTLAKTLPVIDDTQDLQDIITGIDSSVSVPKTPALDRLRHRLMEIRTKGF